MLLKFHQTNSLSDDELNRIEKELEEVFDVEYAALLRILSDAYVTGSSTFSDFQRYRRIDNILAEIRKVSERLIDKSETLITEGLLVVGVINFDGVISEISNAVKTPIEASYAPNSKTPTQLSKWAKKLPVGFRSALIKGLEYQGVSIEMQKKFNVILSRFRTILRTEAHNIAMAAQKTAFQTAQKALKPVGITMIRRWNAVRDSATRPDHIRMDGQYEKEGMFTYPDGQKTSRPGIGSARQVINCRCTTSLEVI